MRILSLNIYHGGGKRTAQLADWLLAKGASVLVLPEWRDNASGRHLRDRLVARGFHTIAAMQRRSNSNSVLLAAIDCASSWKVTPPNSMAGDLILVEIQNRVRILGCYFPQRQAKAPFFRQCIELAADNCDLPFVMIGDFNTGRNGVDVEGAGMPFHCADLFQTLSGKSGLSDLWRKRHGDLQEWTWRSSANGFRIDHAFGNEAFLRRFPTFRCELDHSPRLSGLTDHSAILVEVD